MKRIRKRYIYGLITAITLFAVAILAMWLLVPLSEADLKNADATVERTDRFLLLSGNDTLMVFSSFNGKDQLKGGVSDIHTQHYLPARESGMWVNRIPVIPSCSGRVVVLDTGCDTLCDVPDKTIRAILSSEARGCNERITFYKKELSALEYYLRTHSVIDQGFDLIARYDKTVRRQVDSLTSTVRAITAIDRNRPLTIRYSPLYAVIVKNGKQTLRSRCKIISRSGNLNLLRTIDNASPQLGTKVCVYDRVITQRLGSLRQNDRSETLMSKDVRIDSTGVYTGEMDANGKSHGFGNIIATDGSYYEGDWEHGVRQGFGFAMTADKKLKVGEWKNDRYLGEMMTYTTDRIYGIDISRYQHEQKVTTVKKGKRGRKIKTVTLRKYGIDWANLAITSLGNISKKKITGEVCYPISFVYIKSTESTNIRNQYYTSDYASAKRHGYKVGAYHFFSWRTTGTAQAQYFISHTHYAKGDFPPVLDVECTDAQISKMGGNTALYKKMKSWLTHVETTWHVKPVIYVSQKFIRQHLLGFPDLLRDYPVWIAGYGQYRPEVNLVYWQLCPDGRVSGIHGAVDINVFNGFKKEFEGYPDSMVF